jgi:hypothetical protein
LKLNNHFKQFVANISLNPTRVEKIDSAVRNWKKKFKEDEEINEIFIDYYTQGSYSTDTGVRPKSGEEFDVDVVLVMDIDEEDDPKDILHHIKDRIKSHKEFEDRVKAKDRCVRIEYSNEFHVDVVPAFEFGTSIKIPSKREKEWTETNPAGFKDWCDDINNKSDNYFSKVAKILKHWRDNNVGKETAPKSILLTTLTGNAFTKKSSIAETLVETLDNMILDIENLLFWLSEDDDVPFVKNPSLQEENLARNWTKLKAKRFLNKLKSLKVSCQEAMDETDKDKSIEKWQDIFGDNYFPSELSEAKAMANTIQKGSVFVSSTGALNKDSGVLIKDHRFYGIDSK